MSNDVTPPPHTPDALERVDQASLLEPRILVEADRLAEWNSTDEPFGEPGTLHEMFEAQVRRSPERVAVMFQGRSLSYEELGAQVASVATSMLTLGVTPGDVVAVLMNRCLEVPGVLLGIMKVGASYLPLDPSEPSERLHHALTEANARMVVTDADSSMPAVGGRLTVQVATLLDGAAPSTSSAIPRVQPDAVAYIIFTSGSTGRPKGAVLSHRGVRNRLLWGIQHYGLGAGNRVLNKSPLTFDVSVWEIFAPVLCGATLVVAPPDVHRDPAKIAALIRESSVTHADFVPSAFRVFLEHPKAAECKTLALVTCAGEALTPDLLLLAAKVLPATTIYNLYGPTEASLAVTFWAWKGANVPSEVPIGRPMSNCKVYVLDEDLEPLPIGSVGELYIGGLAPGLGYVGQPALTDQRFIPNPFPNDPAPRLYRTGDRARWSADGELHFAGRVDEQVKIRGYRIEPAEVEAILARHPAVAEAAVVARQVEHAEKDLVAFVRVKGGAAVSDNEVRAHVRQHLPRYMVPTHVEFVASIPLTRNGKADRATLISQALTSSAPVDAEGSPRTELERRLVEIWQRVLKRAPIGVFDDYFDMGGDSLKGLLLLSEMERELGTELSMGVLFEEDSLTIAGLASRLAGMAGSTSE